MTGSPRNPNEEQPEEMPGQQVADEGGGDRGLSGADIGDDPGDNELGGG